MTTAAMTKAKGRHLYILRTDKGYNQTEFGALLGVSQSRISQLENELRDEELDPELVARAQAIPPKPARGKARAVPPGEPASPGEPGAERAAAPVPAESTPVAPADAAALAISKFFATLTDAVGALPAAREAPASAPRPEAAAPAPALSSRSPLMRLGGALLVGNLLTLGLVIHLEWDRARGPAGYACQEPLPGGEGGLGEDGMPQRVSDYWTRVPAVEGQQPVAAWKMPKAPLIGQKRAPCTGHNEYEFSGACWWSIGDAPCPDRSSETGGKCYMPVPEDPTRPVASPRQRH